MRRSTRRRIAGVEIGTVRPFGRIWQKLEQDAAGAPMPTRTVFSGAEFFCHRKPYARRDLFRAREIFMRGLFKVAACERHQTLITIHFRTAIDGHGKVTSAEQLSGLRLVLG